MVDVRQQNEALVTAVFRHHPQHNPAKSAEAGRPIYDDLEVCQVNIAGNQLTIAVFPALAISHQEDNGEGLGFTVGITYAERFSKQYQQFKAKVAQTKDGTPLSEVPFLTEGKRAELRALAIFTVEALAMLEGPELKRLGMEGRTLKAQAQAYIDNAAKGAGSTQQALVIEELLAQVTAQQDQIKELRAAQIKKGAKASVVDKLPVPEDAFDEEDDGLAPDEGDADAYEEEETGPLMTDSLKSVEYEFREMTDQQIKEFITENTGEAPRGKLPRTKLLQLAASSIASVQESSKKNAEEAARRRT